jgi:3alpha(or 20beta)-hydroxysteroid dehydrogenase
LGCSGQAGVDNFGGIDILENNAGTGAAPAYVEEDEATHRRLLDLNLTGSWAGMRAVIPAGREAPDGQYLLD